MKNNRTLQALLEAAKTTASAFLRELFTLVAMLGAAFLFLLLLTAAIHNI